MHRKKGIASSSSSNIVKNGRRNQVSLRPPLLNRNETNKTVNNDKDVVESQSCRLKQSNHEITISEKHQVTNLVESRHNPTNEETSNTVISQQLEETAHLNISIIVKYNCPVFLLIRTDLANSIAKGALSIRTNEDVFAVIKLREQMLGLLLSYSLPWLWLGLETVFQKHISIEDMLDNFNDPCRSQRRQLIGLHSLDSQKLSLIFREFISDKVLNDHYIHRKYSKNMCMFLHGNSEVKYKKELYQVILKRILTIVLCLNDAKQNHAVEAYPLFNAKSQFKSTKDVLALISRDYLGSGNILKELKKLGITSCFNETNITVQKKSVYLRDRALTPSSSRQQLPTVEPKISDKDPSMVSVLESTFNCKYKAQIISVQACIRRYQAIQQYKAEQIRVSLQNLRMKTASKKVQRMYKDWKVRTSATIIQKVCRGFLARVQYSYDLSDIVFVQSLARRKRACKLTKEKRSFVSSQHIQRV